MSTHWALAGTRTNTAYTDAFCEYLSERMPALQTKRIYLATGQFSEVGFETHA